jgi:hypothetical protein
MMPESILDERRLARPFAPTRNDDLALADENVTSSERRVHDVVAAQSERAEPQKPGAFRCTRKVFGQVG